ncbi:MAG: hypothetical protein HRU33_22505 [Rhodobacteraceae bacterium]|nr:hypothetical protein [Paracoccaceae bacterium]
MASVSSLASVSNLGSTIAAQRAEAGPVVGWIVGAIGTTGLYRLCRGQAVLCADPGGAPD